MSTPDNKKLVESLIDSMVEGKVSSKDAVSSLVESAQAQTELPETVEFTEGEKITCPGCGSEDIAEGYVESEDGGSKIPAMVCESCGIGLVESIEDEGDDNIVEAEIDEDNPACPACGCDDLSAQMDESGDGEVMILTCNGCKTDMVVVD